MQPIPVHYALVKQKGFWMPLPESVFEQRSRADAWRQCKAIHIISLDA
jgi:hypothetical protein